ncbi:RnfH family protein [Candidatus Thioglobus sp.]|nr:RnfH family protein [Candidatus Thioglobus sp.]MDB3893800.1 RnfH family protein [Candidatus Thioglobus sp.]MDC0888935.1 RnfH family protein [Candidatus Thioglobus sp.]MDC0904234.1 RnfH family protein [Candidatus Thioglobus sp.]MDC0965577.1 RnfH family protein [Candidatus Thioglobus sp.]
MHIEVAYALEDKQTLLDLEVDADTTLKQAIELSGILETYPQINLTRNKTGIFGKIVKLDTILREKDRVEIYRPLIADPKEVRKERAAQGKKMRSGKKS